MTKEKHQLKAEIREVLGRKVKKLRKEGLSPATVYGNDFKSLTIQINTKELNKLFKEVGEAGLVELVIDGKDKIPVLLRNPQYDPISDELIHIDCYKVNLKEKIKTMISLEFVGESESVREGNLLITATNEIEVEALPTDLPEHIEVDLSVLENLDSVVTVADLNVDRSKIEVLSSEDQVVVKTEEPKEEVIEEEEVSPEDVEVTGQKGEGEDKEEDGEEKKDEGKNEGKEDKKEEEKKDE